MTGDADRSAEGPGLLTAGGPGCTFGSSLALSLARQLRNSLTTGRGVSGEHRAFSDHLHTSRPCFPPCRVGSEPARDLIRGEGEDPGETDRPVRQPLHT